MDPLGTDSCRETVSMELPVPNGSMRHWEIKCEIDDTRMIMHGASCTIAARCVHGYVLITQISLGEPCLPGTHPCKGPSRERHATPMTIGWVTL
jgi:hypothetical protein